MAREVEVGGAREVEVGVARAERSMLNILSFSF